MSEEYKLEPETTLRRNYLSLEQQMILNARALDDFTGLTIYLNPKWEMVAMGELLLGKTTHPDVNRAVAVEFLADALRNTEYSTDGRGELRIDGMLEVDYSDAMASQTTRITRKAVFRTLATAISRPDILVAYLRREAMNRLPIAPLHYLGYAAVQKRIQEVEKTEKITGHVYRNLADILHRAQMNVLTEYFSSNVRVGGKEAKIACEIPYCELSLLDLAFAIGMITEGQRDGLRSRATAQQRAAHVIVQGHAYTPKAGPPDEDIDGMAFSGLAAIGRAAEALEQGRELPSEIFDKTIYIISPLSLSRTPPAKNIVNYFDQGFIAQFTRQYGNHSWLEAQSIFLANWLRSKQLDQKRRLILEGTSRGALMVNFMSKALGGVYKVIMRKPAGYRQIDIFYDLDGSSLNHTEHRGRFKQIFRRDDWTSDGAHVKVVEQGELISGMFPMEKPSAEVVEIHLNDFDHVVNGGLHDIFMAEHKFQLPGVKLLRHPGNHDTPPSDEDAAFAENVMNLKTFIARLPLSMRTRRGVVLRHHNGQIIAQILL